jgi:YkoY family integral membrane protein
LNNPEFGNALRYGIWGAYLFRGLSLFFVSWLLNNPEFGNVGKILGGLYLARLAYKHFTPEVDSVEEGDVSWIERIVTPLGISLFWMVVIEVEILDFIFSIDNIFAVSAMTQNMYAIIAAVFLAILSMRFITQKMSVLMEKHPYLESRAYIVIALIGLKLVASGAASWAWPESSIARIIHAEWFDMVFSLLAIVLFLPIGISTKEYANANTTINDVDEVGGF